MKKAIVYTRTGDDGTTSLVGGQRVSKASARLESYGTIDELNSHIGLLGAEIADEDDAEFLRKIQWALFKVGTLLATAPKEGEPLPAFDQEEVARLEAEIDKVEAGIPPMRCFILPAGCRAAAQAHVCRTVCRRAERCILRLREEAPVDPVLLSYVNRLSDYFFDFARKLNFLAGIDEKRGI